MTVKFYLLTALLGFSAAAQAQTTPAKTPVTSTIDNSLGQHTVYFGVMGSGILLSAHYDFRFKPNQLGWGVHAGIGYAAGIEETTTYYYTDSLGGYQYEERRNPPKLTIPFGVSYLMGKADKPHRLEFGFGATYMNGDAEIFDDKTTPDAWLLVATIGYRRYYFGNRMMWKIAFTPVISLAGAGYPLPYAEGGIGIRF